MSTSRGRRACHRLSFLLLLLPLLAARAVAQECRSASVVRVNSRYNTSGHWETKMLVERSSTAPGRGAPEMMFEARPTVSLCGGRRYDRVDVKLEGPPPPPGPGYELAQGLGYYRVHTEKVTWDQAKAACEAESAHLLIINTEAEDKAVQDLLRRTPQAPPILFVGFNDRISEGNFITIFGEPLSALEHQRWKAGEPNGKRVENCGAVLSATGALNDESCESKIGFICEQRIG